MKIRIFSILVLCMILTGCANATNLPEQNTEPVPVETQTEAADTAAVIQPIPDTTMEAMKDSVLNISFEQGDFYRDDSGTILLRMQIYSYDKFDMVDISAMEAGDTILLSGEVIPVNSVERNDYGTVLVNGGLDAGGFDLATDDSGIYYVQGYSDMKSWYLAGEAECPVSGDFIFTDSADLEKEEATYSAESLLDRTIWKISPSWMWRFAFSTIAQYSSLENRGVTSESSFPSFSSAFTPFLTRSARASSSSVASFYPSSMSPRDMLVMKMSFCLTWSNAMTLSKSMRSTSLKFSVSITSRLAVGSA